MASTLALLLASFGSSIVIVVAAVIIAIIAQLAVLAYAISKIYKTKFSMFNAFLVLILQAILWFVIGLVIFLIFGSSLLLPLLLGH